MRVRRSRRSREVWLLLLEVEEEEDRLWAGMSVCCKARLGSETSDRGEYLRISQRNC